MSLPSLFFRYSFFAIVATLVNLAVQRLIFFIGGDQHAIIFALVAGTGAGLLVKYLLDKRWIFHDLTSDIRSHGRKFSLYTLMGIFTTLIFWGFETVFWLTWQTNMMREVGAVIGLSIGYVVKYQLDRRFVFTDTTLTTGTSI